MHYGHGGPKMYFNFSSESEHQYRVYRGGGSFSDQKINFLGMVVFYYINRNERRHVVVSEGSNSKKNGFARIFFERRIDPEKETNNKDNIDQICT